MRDKSESTSIRERLAGTLVTPSHRAFLDAADNDLDLFIFVTQQLQFQSAMDAAVSHFKKTNPKLTTEVVEAHMAAIREMVFCRYVENVLVYLADILREVLRKQPAILSSSERITMERLVKADSVDQLVHEAIDAKVSTLSNSGFRDLAIWFKDRKIPLAEVTPQLQEYIDVRNVLVHNRGRVDERFLRNTKRSDWKQGDRILLSTEYVGASAEHLGKFVTVSDDLIATKFNLERQPY